jgi:peroxiredoxin
VKLQDLLTPAEKATTEILGVSPDKRPDLEKMAQKVLEKAPGQLAITLLSDPDLAVIDRYGLRNETAAQQGRLLPHPTTYVIDAAGVVRWKFTEVNYKIRPTNEMILEALRQIR